jgi:DNA-directed RNA polymerase subunit alpha
MELINFTDAIRVKKVSEDSHEGIFEVEGLYKGYGVMVGNALRRVLLSSMPGAAITRVKIKNVSHEFSTLPGVVEDIVEITLNLKRVCFQIHSIEPQVLTLKVKGEKEVKASDIQANAQVTLVSPDVHIATLTEKKAEIDMELTVERGFGYVPANDRKTEKLPVGVIALDAIFSPIVRVNFSVENMRVGDRADYNRVILSIGTDGSIMPSQALKQAGEILKNHFTIVGDIEAANPNIDLTVKETKKPAAKKTTKAKKKVKKEDEVDSAEESASDTEADA